MTQELEDLFGEMSPGNHKMTEQEEIQIKRTLDYYHDNNIAGQKIEPKDLFLQFTI